MNLLSIDTTTKNVSIFLKKGDEVFSSFLLSELNTSESLLPAIDKLLTENKTDIQHLDYLAMNIGPGSFTGVRIGMALFKAFMLSLQVKCVTVNSFELLSYNINDKNPHIIVLESGNSDYYVAIYENKVTYTTKNIEELKVLSQNYKIYSSFEIEGLDYQIVTHKQEDLVEIACQKIENEDFVSCFELEPLYIKKAQAERDLRAKIYESLSIEKATEEDISFLIKLDKLNFSYEPYTEESFRNDIKNNIVFVAKINGELVGYVDAIDSDVIEILKICVKKEYRNLGIAMKLIEKVKTKDIFIEVNVNSEAVTFYKRNGFKLISTRKKYYKDGSDCLVMSLKS